MHSAIDELNNYKKLFDIENETTYPYSEQLLMFLKYKKFNNIYNDIYKKEF